MVDERTAAAYLGVPARTLGQWRYQRRGPAYIKVGPKHVRYLRADLDDWITANRVEHESAS